MYLARYETNEGSQLWGLTTSEGGIVSSLTVPMSQWAPILTAEGSLPKEFMGQQYASEQLQVLAPVDPTSRIFGVGMNYRSHLEKLGATPASTPASFMKPLSAVVDPGKEIRYPITTEQLDYEVELVIVVGQELNSSHSAIESVLGYTVGNDISPRDVERQTGGPDLYSMKAQDRTAPIGPRIVTAKTLGTSGQPNLNIMCEVNGEVRQTANTLDMLFDVEYILTFLNQRNRLQPGDLIFTGTTGGVGLEDGRFLQPGDEVVVSADLIGRCINSVGAKEAP